jgi:hypothetical protein
VCFCAQVSDRSNERLQKEELLCVYVQKVVQRTLQVSRKWYVVERIALEKSVCYRIVLVSSLSLPLRVGLGKWGKEVFEHHPILTYLAYKQRVDTSHIRLHPSLRTCSWLISPKILAEGIKRGVFHSASGFFFHQQHQTCLHQTSNSLQTTFQSHSPRLVSHSSSF